LNLNLNLINNKCQICCKILKMCWILKYSFYVR
jgi:hypothetical protein